MNSPSHQTQDSVSKSDFWFEQLISSIKTDKLLFDTNTVDPKKKELYNNLISGNTDKVLSEMYKTSSRFYITKIVTDYIDTLKNLDVNVDLAFDLSDSSVLVWAQIEDNDEKSEDELILTEATINANYSNYGFSLSSTIIEKGDGIPIPNHYYPLK